MSQRQEVSKVPAETLINSNEVSKSPIEEVGARSVSRGAQRLLLTIIGPLLLTIVLMGISDFLKFFPFNRLYYTAPNYFLVIACLWVSLLIKDLKPRSTSNFKLMTILIGSCSLIALGADFLTSLQEDGALGLENLEDWVALALFFLWQLLYFYLLFYVIEKFDFLIFKCKH